MFKRRRWRNGVLGCCLANSILACGSAPSSTDSNTQPAEATPPSDTSPSNTSPSNSAAPSSSPSAPGSVLTTTPPTTGPTTSNDASETTTSTTDDAAASNAGSSDGAASHADATSESDAVASNSAEAATSGESGEASTDANDETSAAPNDSSDDCEHHGNVSYTFNNPEGWPDDVVQKLTAALDEAVYYYNCYADLTKALHINYKPDVPTAEGNVDGWISFGSDRNYMQTATAMHEIAHTLGVGYAPWSEFIQDGKWTGAAVVAVISNLPVEQRDPDMYSQRTYITCDNQHFWPYGLNQASEHQSEWSLINHVRVVAAMNADKASVR